MQNVIENESCAVDYCTAQDEIFAEARRFLEEEVQAQLIDMEAISAKDAQILYQETEIAAKDRKIEELERHLLTAQ